MFVLKDDVQGSLNRLEFLGSIVGGSHNLENIVGLDLRIQKVSILWTSAR